MYNKWRYKKAIKLSRSKYDKTDLIKVNSIMDLIKRNNKNIDLIVHITPKTLIIEEV